MIDPFDVALEGSNEFVHPIKDVARLLASEVAMITFARLVVVPEDADTFHDVSEPILVRVRRAREWCRKLP
jgi:hypothetical protein